MRLLIATSMLATAALAFCAGASVGAGRAQSKVTTLLHAPLSDAFAPGRDVLVDLVEIPPNATLDRHWHPGEEFHYYLDGEPEVQLHGKPAARPALGTVGHVPYQAVHRAGAGARGARILVFRVHARGEPWRYLEPDAPAASDVQQR
jgi:quercetin dioxygenase-like cupin family protein